tara:strand:+ start:122 stop:361 length:240 start_codon:yes stop_codon:yes gene_type:complete
MRAIVLKDSNRIDEVVSLITKAFYKGDIEKFRTEIMKLEFKNLNYENSSLLAFSNILSNSKNSRQSFSKSFNIPLMDQI